MSQDNRILKHWRSVKKLPGGRWLFSKMLGLIVPYSSTIRPQVLTLESGYAEVALQERRAVRNHLKSIHAIALINLGEVATGLAALTTINQNMRGIVINIAAEYVKKARGRLVATARFQLPDTIEDNTSCKVVTEIRDADDDIVCIVTATWLLGYRKSE